MLMRKIVLNPSNTTDPPPPTGTQTPPATTSSSTTLYISIQPPKSGWTPASKAGVGIGVVLIVVALAGAMYFLLRWIRRRKLVGVEKRQKSKVMWNVGPVWARKVTKHVGRERGVSPQELDAEQKSGMDMASPGVSEALTVTMGSRYEGSTVGSWGGELEGVGVRKWLLLEDIFRVLLVVVGVSFEGERMSPEIYLNETPQVTGFIIGCVPFSCSLSGISAAMAHLFRAASGCVLIIKAEL
jgi:hypothetical protein